MSAEDVALALMAMEDDEIATRLAAGEFEAAGDLRLSEEEAAMVKEAASERADVEVEGFAFTPQSSTIKASVYASQGPLPNVAPRFDSILGRNFGGNIGTLADQNWAYA